MTGILSDAAEYFKARNTPVERWYEDDRGRYAFTVTIDGQRFHVAAKQYLHDGRASFMEKLVERAIDTDAYLLLFTGGAGGKLVFDPRYVHDAGEPSDPETSQRQRHTERWLELPTRGAVTFTAWYDNGATPTSTNSNDTDDEQRPERPHDVTAWSDH